MRFARESFWACCAHMGAATITKKTARIERFTLSSLDNIRVQLVMMSPKTLGRVIQELFRIFPGSRETLHHASLQHVLGTVAFPNLFEQARPNLFHHVALGLEFG